MWICPLCRQTFTNTNQSHSCGDKLLSDYLDKKSEHTLSLFWHFVEQYQKLGEVTVHATKSMIAFSGHSSAGPKRIAYIIRLGKDFVDVVFPFTKRYEDNLCFHKIAQVPDSQQFNHHFRMCRKEDINKEVKQFMKKAYERS